MLCVFVFMNQNYAEDLLQKIEATLNKQLVVTYNGDKQEFKDVNDKIVYPITYNRTTYLPVRAIGDLGEQTFESGVGYQIWNSDYSCTDSNRVLLFDVSDYKTIKFTANSSKYDINIVVYAENKDGDINKICNFILSPNELLEQEINISNYTKIGFGANNVNSGDENDGFCKILNPTLYK